MQARSATPQGEKGAFAEIIATWLNRSMGKDDLYPFVLSPAVLAKLEFVHDLVQMSRT